MDMGILCKNGAYADIPLRGAAITSRVCGIFQEVTIKQSYENRGRANIEAVYTFPVPDTAAVTGFKAKIGDKSLTAAIMEKGSAFKVYDDSVRKGDSAFLLEQFRPNVFQISLGQILQGEKVDIEIDYIDELKIDENEFRISIPTVVAPRYIPGNVRGGRRGMGMHEPTDRVPDADFITPPIGEMDYGVTIEVSIDMVRPVASVESPSHKIRVENLPEGRARVSLSGDIAQMDRDFVLICKLKGEAGDTGMAYEADGTGVLHLAFTPDIPMYEEDKPMDYIFLIDVSGSMSGVKLNQAKTALNICIRNLTSRDSFNIIAFESSCHCFSETGSLPFDQKSLDGASAWIDSLHPMGGTEIFEAIKYGLGNSDKDKVILLFTDGEVGNEKEILEFVKQHIGRCRIYTFGIDTAVNSYFINSLAKFGRGKAEFIYPGERIDDKVIRQFSRITSSMVKDAVLDWGSLKAADVFPHGLDELYSMEPVYMTVKYEGKLGGSLVIRGKLGDNPFEHIVSLDSVRVGSEYGLLEKIWARKRIESLENGMNGINPRRAESIKEEIIELSKKYCVMSSYTSLVAVNERDIKAGSLPETVVVPAAMPESWDMHVTAGTLPIGALAMAPVPSGKILCSSSRLFLSEDVVCYKSSRGYEAEKYMDVPEEDIINGMLRALAGSQRANGAFADQGESDPSALANTTALAVIAFAASGTGSQYRRQIEKSIYFLLDFLKTQKRLADEKTGLNVRMALAFAFERGPIGGNVKDDIWKVLEEALATHGVGAVRQRNRRSADAGRRHHGGGSPSWDRERPTVIGRTIRRPAPK
jgi:Ca-activated chloride channel family protein